MRKILYKVLNKNMLSPFRNFRYELNKIYTCKNFDNNKNNVCSNGFYATGLDGLIYSYRKGKLIFQCEVWGKNVEIDQYKRRYRNLKLIKKCNIDDIKEKIKNLNLGYDLYHAMWSINPLNKKVKKIKQEQIILLKKWASVRDSVGASVWDLVRDSVGALVRDSVGASVGAYISSLFQNIKKWKYIEHKENINPFQSCIDLWHQGLVPSFDGEIWRLHAGKKAKIVYKINKNKLKEL